MTSLKDHAWDLQYSQFNGVLGEIHVTGMRSKFYNQLKYQDIFFLCARREEYIMSVRVVRKISPENHCPTWHHSARPVMQNGESRGMHFPFNSHTNNGLFFVLTIKIPIFFIF